MNDEKENAMSVPDGLPTLSYGGHEPDSGQACVMELVSVLAGEQWSDGPKCTNTTLADFAIWFNDHMDDEHRHGLVEIAPLLIATVGRTPESDRELDAKLIARKCVLYDEWRSMHPTRSYSTMAYANERGVAILRDCAQLCDEHNGYDRSAQEPRPVVETLAKIHERAGVS